jgi:hypothetical protein
MATENFSDLEEGGLYSSSISDQPKRQLKRRLIKRGELKKPGRRKK